MSRADEIFIQNCKDILENGIWDTDRAVHGPRRPHPLGGRDARPYHQEILRGQPL